MTSFDIKKSEVLYQAKINYRIMIRKFIKYWIVLFLVSCGHSNKPMDSYDEKDTDKDSIYSKNVINKTDDSEIDKNKFREESINSDFKENKIYTLNDTILEDFNGDGIIDKAEFKKENEKAGILITDGKSNNIYKLGLGNMFAHMDDFGWVDFWGVVKDTLTYEILIKDDEIIGDTIVSLEHPSIFVRKDEVGGGVITYKKGTFIWIHQAD